MRVVQGEQVECEFQDNSNRQTYKRKYVPNTGRRLDLGGLHAPSAHAAKD